MRAWALVLLLGAAPALALEADLVQTPTPGPAAGKAPRPRPRPVDPCGMGREEPDCLTFLDLKRDFARLRPAASALAAELLAKAGGPRGQGPAPREVPDVSLDAYVEGDPRWNATYRHRSRTVTMTLGFLAGTRRMPHSAVVVLAHELGHHVQAAVDEPDPGHCDPRYESQADAWGVEIMRRAGYGADQVHASVAKEFGEDAIQDDEWFAERTASPCQSHPAERVRFSNALIEKQMRAMSGVLGTPEFEATPSQADYGQLGERRAESLLTLAPGRKPEPPTARVPTGLTPPVARTWADVLSLPRGPAGLADLTPPVARDGAPSPRLANEILQAALSLGRETQWRHPLLLQVLSRAAGTDANSLVSATAAGIERLWPSEAAKREALRLTKSLSRRIGDDALGSIEGGGSSRLP